MRLLLAIQQLFSSRRTQPPVYDQHIKRQHNAFEKADEIRTTRSNVQTHLREVRPRKNGGKLTVPEEFATVTANTSSMAKSATATGRIKWRYPALMLFILVAIHLPLDILRMLPTAATTSSSGNPFLKMSNDSQTDYQSLNYNVTYVTSFWAEPVTSSEKNMSSHRAEIEAALLVNLDNPYFHQVVVILDSSSKDANCTHFESRMLDLQTQYFAQRRNQSVPTEELPVLTCVDRSEGQPTYFELFQYATSHVVTGEVVVFSNADHAFDNTVRWARYLKPTSVLVLTTWGYNQTTVPSVVQDHFELRSAHHPWNTRTVPKRCRVTRSSWDTYIFHKSMIQGRFKREDFTRETLDGNRTSFYMNERGAENAALHGLLMNISNATDYQACALIQSWHFHFASKTHKRGGKNGIWKNERDSDRVPGPYRFPRPSFEGAFWIEPHQNT